MTLFVGQAVNWRQRASQIAGLAAVAIGVMGFLGWWVSLPVLSSGILAAATAKPTTVLCLSALGLALMHPDTNSRFVDVTILGVAIITTFDLLDLFGVDLGSDLLNRLLVPRAAAPGLETPFHMINGVPIAILLAVGSLALGRLGRHRFAATALSGVAGAMGTFGLLNYLLTGTRVLLGAAAFPTPLTAVGLLCVAGGIFFRIWAVPAIPKPLPLRHLLIVLGCATIIPLLLFGVYMGLRITDAEIQDTQNRLTSEMRALSADVDREITAEIERLHALAASASLRQGDFAEFQRQAEASLALRRSGHLVVIDDRMQELVDTSVPFGTPLGKATIPQSLVENALSSRKPQVTNLLTSSAPQQPVFSIVVPVQINGNGHYVLARFPGLHAFARLIDAVELPQGWHAAISDAAHRIIAATSDQRDPFTGEELPPAQWRRAAPNGLFEFIDSQGRPSLEASMRSELTGWQTAVWASKALLESRVRTLWWAIGVASLLAFAMVFGIALWLGWIIARSVGQAARATIALKEGAPLPLSETPVAEIETLMEELRETAAELRETAARRQAAEHDLQTSKDRLQLSFNAAHLGWWQFDPRRSMVSVDMRFREIFDVSSDEISIEDLLSRVHPDDAERFWANREAALDPAGSRPYVHQEYRVRHRDGAVRWVESHGLTYFAGAGSERRVVSFGGTVQDITERKDREEKENLLLREINHRAKNMLSVVDSIAHQTATRNPEDFVERFSERIQALSANQDLLVRNEWRGVDVEDLARAQLAHFVDLIDSRIIMHGPKLHLNPASAQAIGLALHELATNAGKYGALSTDTGGVAINWGVTDRDTFTMSWIECGGPPVAPPKRRGFGRIVMESMAERSVGGTIDLEYPPSGVTWHLTCPAANALESGWKMPS